MKLHWGHKLIIVFLLFAGFIIYIFSRAIGDEYEMVTQNYYEKELEFEKTVNQRINARDRGYSLEVVQDEEYLFVRLEGAEQAVTGEMYWYKPDDGRKDMKVEFVSDTTGKAVYPLDKFAKGMYEVHMTWQDGSDTLAIQKTVFVQK